MGTVTSISVEGMTCGHCVVAVRSELERIDGVSHVEVDLASGAVEITSDGPLDRELIGAAVDEAGYEVTE